LRLPPRIDNLRTRIRPEADYIKRVVMVPMRDGNKVSMQFATHDPGRIGEVPLSGNYRSGAALAMSAM
jgi:hypothetical protein